MSPQKHWTYLQGVIHCYQRTECRCYALVTYWHCLSTCCKTLFNQLCKLMIPIFSFVISYCLQAVNPVAIVILVHTENTYEHSFHLEDVLSLPVQSIAVSDRTPGINQWHIWYQYPMALCLIHSKVVLILSCSSLLSMYLSINLNNDVYINYNIISQNLVNESFTWYSLVEARCTPFVCWIKSCFRSPPFLLTDEFLCLVLLLSYIWYSI